MKAVLANILFTILALLPLRIARALAAISAWIVLRFPNNTVCKISAINLSLIKPELDDKAKRHFLRDTINSTLMTAFEMPIIWKKSNEWLNRNITQEVGLEIIEEAIASNRGVIVLCPHIGNWEVFGRKLADYGPTTSLYQPLKLTFLEDQVRKGREKSGAELVPTNRQGISKLIQRLKSGYITGILPDQQPDEGSGLYVPFCGVPAYTMTLIYRLVQKLNCQVVLGYAIRDAKGFQIIFKSVDKEIYSDDKFESIVALSKAVEQSLEEDIAQYQWAYKRFRKQPNGINPYQQPPRA